MEYKGNNDSQARILLQHQFAHRKAEIATIFKAVYSCFLVALLFNLA